MDDIESEIIENLGNLSNNIIASAASKRLATLRQTKPSYFTKVSLYIEALRITSIYNYKLSTRRFISDLFEKVIWTISELEMVDASGGLSLCFKMNELAPKSESVDYDFETSSKLVAVEREALPSVKVIKGFQASVAVQ